MANKLNYYSFSSTSEHDQCGAKYKYNRVEKLKYKKLKSPFFFGSAIDEAVEIIFLSKKKDLSKTEEERQKLDYRDVFEKHLWNAKNNKYELVEVPFNPLVKFSAQDYQPELLNSEDIELVEYVAKLFEIDLEFTGEFEEDLAIIESFIERNSSYYKKDNLDNDLSRVYNTINWCCLLRKGLILLEGVQDWFEENVKETISIQKKFEIKDGDDILVGKLDLVIIDKDGERVLTDFKTSANPYKESDADESPQLTIYSVAENIDRVAFLVFEKKIRKREPRIRNQYIKTTITDDQKDHVFGNIEETIDKIKKKQFDKNKDSCYTYGKCEYFDYCWKGSYKNLEYINKTGDK